MFVDLEIGWTVVGKDGGGDGPVSIVSGVLLSLLLLLVAIDRFCRPEVADLTAAGAAKDALTEGTTGRFVAGQGVWA